MSSVHCITERNICVKFNELLSKGSRDMEGKRKCYKQTGHSYKPHLLIDYLKIFMMTAIVVIVVVVGS